MRTFSHKVTPSGLIESCLSAVNNGIYRGRDSDWQYAPRGGLHLHESRTVSLSGCLISCVLAQRRGQTQHMEEVTDGTKEHRPMLSHMEQHRLVFGGEWATQCL